MKTFSKRGKLGKPQEASRRASSRFETRVPSHAPESTLELHSSGDLAALRSEQSRTTGASTVANTSRARHNFAQVSIYPKPALQDQGHEPAETKALGSYLPLQRPLSSLAGTSVRPIPGLASKHQALAQASHGGIEIDASITDASAPELRSLLAHEAVHFAQQKGTGRSAPRNLLEAEASQLSPHVLGGRPVWPALSGHSSVPLKQSTTKPKGPTVEELREIDEAWKKAMGPKKTKLDHLKAQLRYLQQLRTLIRERQSIETRRNLLDLNMVNLIQAGAEGGARRKGELEGVEYRRYAVD